MTILILLSSVAVCIYGIVTSMKPKTPLFYKIVTYGFCSYFLGTTYSILYKTLFPFASGFHAGYLGYAGTFFFLFSSYFGALDRLADGHEPVYKKYRIAALIPPAFILLAGTAITGRLLLIPVAATAYYACKHLILPDVDMGIIRVMRPYNGIILLFCMLQPFTANMAVKMEFFSGGYCIPEIANILLIAVSLPLARKEVQKWFI